MSHVSLIFLRRDFLEKQSELYFHRVHNRASGPVSSPSLNLGFLVMEPSMLPPKVLPSPPLYSVRLCFAPFSVESSRILLGRSSMRSVIFAKTTGGIYCG
nr:MAG TPA: hypothetical protein [Caudoviricetes sp.]